MPKPRRLRIARVELAAWATLVAFLLAAPVWLLLVHEPDTRIARTPRPASGPGADPVPARPRGLDAPERAIGALREAGDVDGLLGALAKARADGAPRLQVLAVASLRAVPGDLASAALRGIVEAPDAPVLERTTALGALWERGERGYVEATSREADVPELRSKARVLLWRDQGGG